MSDGADSSAKEVRESQIRTEEIEPEFDFPVITLEGLLLPAITVEGFPGVVALPVKKLSEQKSA